LHTNTAHTSKLSYALMSDLACSTGFPVTIHDTSQLPQMQTLTKVWIKADTLLTVLYTMRQNMSPYLTSTHTPYPWECQDQAMY